RIQHGALRFRPTTEMFAALNQAVPAEAQFGGGNRGGNRNAARGTTGAAQSAGSTPQSAGSQNPQSAASTPRSAGSQNHQGAGNAAQRAPSDPQRAPTNGPGGERQGGFGRGGRGGFDPARMMERFKGMPPGEQAQFIARMKDRGQDTSAFEKAMKPALRTKYGAPASAQ